MDLVSARRVVCAWMLAAWALASSGCAPWTQRMQPLPNPLLAPPLDRELVWDEVVDVVDDYFTVDREQRVRQMGDVLTVGRLDTFPQGGATYLEPWRGDAANAYERLEGTLQSIRRRANVEVTPLPDGYAIAVAVHKELEDVPRPDYSTVGTATFRHDQSLPRGIDLDASDSSGRLRQQWIPQGRDCAMEQKLLAEIEARLRTAGRCGPAGCPPPRWSWPRWTSWSAPKPAPHQRPIF